MLELGLKIFLSYLIGSFNGSLLVGKYLGGVDIRKIGSGNAGGTNALRTKGKVFAFLVISIDVGKGIIPVVLFPTMTMFGTDSLEVSREWLTYVCGAAVIFGHCFPVWFDFSGGKGAATTIGVLLGTSPFILSVGMIIWLLILVLIG
ncbi:MAG: glycerol-3-phosphate acyltransferase, partial [Pseudomonadota bacterium]|nr:glycerol-3-phosphate acyltransferase [Pseudomonadota bacterium]